MKHKLTRFEVNKEIRHIMARHRVDSSLLQYQCHGYEIELSGIMWHTDDTDFDANQIDAMMKDFQKTLCEYEVKGQTENWSFSAHSINSVYSVAADHDEESEEEMTLVKQPMIET